MCLAAHPLEFPNGRQTSAVSTAMPADFSFLVNLFKEGKLSSGTAATWLGIGRLAFLRLAFEAGATLLEDADNDLTRETALL